MAWEVRIRRRLDARLLMAHRPVVKPPVACGSRLQPEDQRQVAQTGRSPFKGTAAIARPSTSPIAAVSDGPGSRAEDHPAPPVRDSDRERGH